MSLEKILEKSESKVIDEAFVNDIKKEFDIAVNEKAELKAKDILDEQKAEFDKSVDDLIETAIKTIEIENQEKFNESVEAEVEKQTTLIESKLEEKSKQELEELEEKVTLVLTHAIDTFVNENSSKWDDEVKVVKADALKEKFEGLAEEFGVQISTVDESTKISEVNSKLEEAVKEIYELKQKEILSKKENILKESKEGLSAPQSDKLDKLMEDVEFIDEKQYLDRIDLFKSALGDIKESVKKVEDKTEDIKESYVPYHLRKKN